MDPGRYDSVIPPTPAPSINGKDESPRRRKSISPSRILEATVAAARAAKGVIRGETRLTSIRGSRSGSNASSLRYLPPQTPRETVHGAENQQFTPLQQQQPTHKNHPYARFSFGGKNPMQRQQVGANYYGGYNMPPQPFTSYTYPGHGVGYQPGGQIMPTPQQIQGNNERNQIAGHTLPVPQQSQVNNGGYQPYGHGMPTQQGQQAQGYGYRSILRKWINGPYQPSEIPYGQKIDPSCFSSVKERVVGSQVKRNKLPIAPGYPEVPSTQKEQAWKPEKNADGKYPCRYCSKTYENSRNLKRHLLRHYDLRPFKCQLCGDDFSRSDILKRHWKKCSTRHAISDPGHHLAGVRGHSTGAIPQLSMKPKPPSGSMNSYYITAQPPPSTGNTTQSCPPPPNGYTKPIVFDPHNGHTDRPSSGLWNRYTEQSTYPHPGTQVDFNGQPFTYPEPLNGGNSSTEAAHQTGHS